MQVTLTKEEVKKVLEALEDGYKIFWQEFSGTSSEKYSSELFEETINLLNVKLGTEPPYTLPPTIIPPMPAGEEGPAQITNKGQLD